MSFTAEFPFDRTFDIYDGLSVVLFTKDLRTNAFKHIANRVPVTKMQRSQDNKQDPQYGWFELSTPALFDSFVSAFSEYYHIKPNKLKRLMILAHALEYLAEALDNDDETLFSIKEKVVFRPPISQSELDSAIRLQSSLSLHDLGKEMLNLNVMNVNISSTRNRLKPFQKTQMALPDKSRRASATNSSAKTRTLHHHLSLPKAIVNSAAITKVRDALYDELQKDDDGLVVVDPISLLPFPKEYGTKLDGQYYDTRSLRAWFSQGNVTCPHSRRRLTTKESAAIWDQKYK